jgi:hypothetical protein
LGSSDFFSFDFTALRSCSLVVHLSGEVKTGDLVGKALLLLQQVNVVVAGPLGFEPRISGFAGQCHNPH